jgi:hypothetical protein
MFIMGLPPAVLNDGHHDPPVTTGTRLSRMKSLSG